MILLIIKIGNNNSIGSDDNNDKVVILKINS